jgi:iron complex outermembrane receptor protein
MTKNRILTNLMATTIICGSLGFAAPAFAQDATPQDTQAGETGETCVPSATVECDSSQAPVHQTNEPGDEEIVVTGTLFRRTNSETPSPVTVLSAESLEQRGVNTVAEAVQRLASNGSGTISEGWNNGSNFAAGANAVSLRGLTVQKTLTIFDGLRMAPYPLADDGHRNFVDLNTIPDAIIDRIEILRDGASSTYGADAVAGVVNIITKKQVVGVHLNASAGISQREDGGEQRVDLTAGYGDLNDQGFNIYVNGMYRRNEEIWARDRGFPWSSGLDRGMICEPGTPATGVTTGCQALSTGQYAFGVNRNGAIGGTTIGPNPVVAPANPTTNARLNEYQLLNPDCGIFGGTPTQLPNSARAFNAAGTIATWAVNQCATDLKANYQTLRPSSERYGFSGRATARIGDNAEAYVAANYMNVNTYSQLTPAPFNDQTTAPQVFLFNPVILPVYVCAAGVGTINPATGANTSTGCTAANGTLNPNNPFAAQGLNATLRGRHNTPRTVETNARALRAAAGLSGSFGGDNPWNYSLEATASEVRLERISEGYLIPQRLADVIARGTYNFVNPQLNSQAINDYVSPDNIKVSISKLWQVGGTIARSLFELPGGPLQAAIGASYREESINDTSANPENLAHPYDRYYTINAVGAVGSRNVKSVFGEIDAPILDQLDVNLSGRYDKYSSGQKNFSPKIGAKFTPIPEVAIRGTYSKGFRIPSFNEAFGLPTTGYTTLSINCTTYAEFCASHNNNQYATGQYSLGRTSVGNPALSSEKSTSFTVGAIFEPMRNVSFTVDYFNIKVRDVIGNISAADQTAALDAFLKTGATNAVPGVNVIAGIADPQFPNARPLPAFVEFSFQNADEERVQGIDLGADIRHDFGFVKLYSSLDASYLIRYEVIRKDGSVERYDGTLSPCDYTSCSGSPKWRGSWQNTLTFGNLNLTGTVYYTHGYDLASIDYGGVKGDCEASIGASVVTYQNGHPIKCKVGAQWNADLTASYRVNDKFMIYANVLNFLDIKPRYDPSATYSLYNYNVAWGQPNIVGRYMRVGARVDF